MKHTHKWYMLGTDKPCKKCKATKRSVWSCKVPGCHKMKHEKMRCNCK